MMSTFTGHNETSQDKRELLKKILKERINEKQETSGLSQGQYSLWFEHKLAPLSTAYNLYGAWHIKTVIDENAFLKALDQLVERHPILNTTYFESDEDVEQKNDSKSPLDIKKVEVYEWSYKAIQQYIEEEVNKPFDLESDPVFRAHLLVREQGYDDILMLCIHHIAVDAWSLNILLDELGKLYKMFTEVTSDNLPLPQKGYNDFVYWQNNYLESNRAKQDLAYWKDKLAGELPVIDLPTDYSRPKIRTYDGDQYSFKIGRELTEQLKILSSVEKTTLHTLLLSIFHVFLYRYTNQEDVLIGSFTSGRTSRKFKDTVGYFVNPVVSRSSFVDKDLKFTDFLNRTRRDVLEAIEYQDYPFPLLVDALNFKRDATYPAVFQVAFVLEQSQRLKGNESTVFVDTSEEQLLKLDDLLLKSIPLPTRYVQFDLTLMMEETSEGLFGSFLYNTNLFRRKTIERMANQFVQILSNIIRYATSLLDAIPILSKAEFNQQMSEWNDTVTPVKNDVCMHHLLETQALENPTELAVTFNEQQLTYQELNERSNQLAHYLSQKGVEVGGKVAIQIDRSLDMLTAVFAILKTGGCFVPIDHAHPSKRKKGIIDDANIEFLISTSDQKDIQIENVHSIYLDEVRNKVEKMSTQNLNKKVLATNLAYMIYTSGSTGEPKGVLVEHKGIWNLAEAQRRTFNVNKGSNILQFASFGFDAWIFECVMAIRNGSTLHLTERDRLLSSDKFINFLNEKEITHITLPPSVLMNLPDKDLPALEFIISAGEACSANVVEKWLKKGRFFNAYGPAEATVWVTIEEFSDESKNPTIGKPIQNMQCYILNDQLKPVPVGVVGELFLSGIGLARGYHNRPNLNEETFIEHPFVDNGQKLYRTGDLARFLPNGKIEYIGRKDGQVTIRGMGIELGEIQSKIESHHSILEAFIKLYDDEVRGEHLIAYIKEKDDNSFNKSEMKTLLNEELPYYMIPSKFILISDFPLNINGKIDQEQLPYPWLKTESDSFIQPHTYYEKQIASIWQKVLKDVKNISIKDNFFELGGHSLLITRVIARINRAFAVQLEIHHLFETPILEELSLKVQQLHESSSNKNTVKIKQISKSNEVPVTHAQKRIWFLQNLDNDNSAYHIPGVLRLEGLLDEQSLIKSFQELVKRHELLRAVFKQSGSEVFQVIKPEHTEVNMEIFHLNSYQENDQLNKVNEMVRSEAKKPFDLERGPLFRLSLIKLDTKEHILLVTIHHIVTDGWSMGILMNELQEYYKATKLNIKPKLADLTIQYTDYAVWQKESLKQEQVSHQLSYWEKQLGGNLPLLQLPTDYRRPRNQTYKGAQVSVKLPKNLSDDLRKLSKDNGATLFMTLLSVFKLQLYRLTEEEDIIVGTPVAGRKEEELEDIFGLFVNTIALRTDLSENSTFVELLKKVRQVAIGAFDNQDVPFEKLVEVLQPNRNLSVSPIFQVMFNMLNIELPSIELDGLDVTVLSNPEQDSKYDLTMYVEDKEEITCQVVYNKDLFTSERMEHFLEQYQSLVYQTSDNSNLEIKDYSLLTKQSRKLLPHPSKKLVVENVKSIPELFTRSVNVYAHNKAVVYGNESITYKELEDVSNRIAHCLIERNLEKGETVIIYANRSMTLIKSILGVLKAGLAFSIVDSTHPPVNVLSMVESIDAQGLITFGHHNEFSFDFDEKISQLKCYLSLNDTSDVLSRFSEFPPAINVNENDLAYVSFTSGTTGERKAVKGSHGPLSRFINWQQKTFNLNENDRFSMLSGLGHDPLLRDIFTALCIGATVYIPSEQDIINHPGLLNWMQQEKITISHLTPSMATILTGLNDKSGTDKKLSKMRYFFFGGDTLTLSHVKRVKVLAGNASCVNFYGTTETPQAMSYSKVTSDRLMNNTIPIGKGRDGVQILVLNEGQSLSGIGEHGEIYVRTPDLTQGYVGDQLLTNQNYVPSLHRNDQHDFMFKTGDIGRYLPNGEVEILGRNDELVNIRGYRLHLDEVKETIEEINGVEQTFVHLESDENGNKTLIAYIVLKELNLISTFEVRNLLKSKLPTYMIPNHIKEIRELPLTRNGKVNVDALPSYIETEVNIAHHQKPRTDIENAVSIIWKQSLGITDVSIDDNFFDLGGHSLLMLSVFEKLSNEVNDKLTMIDLFKYPTIRQLANFLSEEDKKHDSHKQVESRGYDRRRAIELLQQRRKGSV